MLALAIAVTVRIGVFGLFHPVALDVNPVHGQVLVIESSGGAKILEGTASARLQSPARVTGRDGGEAAFILSVPGLDGHPRIQREFHGGLEVLQRDGHLVAIVTMDLETAVASIVAAEGSAAVPFEARKAQAIAARSFLAAGRDRHTDFDFCDTTHCQFLRAPPGDKSAASRAAVETRGRVLTYEGHAIAALYSADCGGHTRTLAEAGWGNSRVRTLISRILILRWNARCTERFRGIRCRGIKWACARWARRRWRAAGRLLRKSCAITFRRPRSRSRIESLRGCESWLRNDRSRRDFGR